MTNIHKLELSSIRSGFSNIRTFAVVSQFTTFEESRYGTKFKTSIYEHEILIFQCFIMKFFVYQFKNAHVMYKLFREPCNSLLFIVS